MLPEDTHSGRNCFVFRERKARSTVPDSCTLPLRAPN